VLGGGLAILIGVPWNATNQRHRLLAELLTEDGNPVTNPDGTPVQINGELEVGRPPGIAPGSDINVPIAVNLAVQMAAGGHRWQVSIDGTVEAEAPFSVIVPPAGVTQQ